MKKNVPLDLLEALQPIADKNLDLVVTIKDANSLFHLKDKDETSTFHFKVISHAINKGKFEYKVEFKPKNKLDVSSHSANYSPTNVKIKLKEWLNILQGYDNLVTVYDNPKIKIYQEEFESKFEIIDEDSEITCFDLEQQVFIDEYIDSSIKKIELLKSNAPKEEVVYLEELIEDANLIKKNLTKETKKQIIRRLSVFWAKARYIGLPVLKEIFINVASEVSKKILMGYINI